MKGTKSFKEIIQAYLERQATNDPLFAPVYAKENKNIDDCITYILNQVKASGCNGFADEEIFGMAMHYYQEDDVKPGAKVNTKVIVNHSDEPKEDPSREQNNEEQAPIVEMKPAKKSNEKKEPKEKKEKKKPNKDQLILF